jgi:RIO-like serine/threonine protein kinase
VTRDPSTATPGLRWLAIRLAGREAAMLERLAGEPGVPGLIEFDGLRLRRRYVPGRPMHEAHPVGPEYFRAALRLLIRIHRRGVAHNDLAKEANWICTPDGRPAVVDFQIAVASDRRGKLFRILAREDVRHLMKHKRTYCPERLTRRQRRMLAERSVPARLWRVLVKPPYLFITRVLLGWPAREGPEERQRP